MLSLRYSVQMSLNQGGRKDFNIKPIFVVGLYCPKSVPELE